MVGKKLLAQFSKMSIYSSYQLIGVNSDIV